MILALLIQVVNPQTCGENHQYITCTLNLVLGIMEDWYGRGLQIAEGIFLSLAALEMVVTGYSAIRKKGDPMEIIQIAAIKGLGIGLIWILINFSQVWLGTSLMHVPLNMSQSMAIAVMNEKGELVHNPDGSLSDEQTVRAPTPATMIGQAIYVVGTTVGAIPARYWGQGVLGLVPFAGSFFIASKWGMALVLIVCLANAFVFVRFGIELFKTIIECYLVTGGGIVLVGFFAFRGSAPIAEGILLYIVQLTIKMFFLILAAFLCLELTDAILAMLSNSEDFLGLTSGNGIVDEASNTLFALPLFAMAIMLGLGAMIAHSMMSIPDKMAQTITQRLSINIKGFLQAM